MFSGISVKSDGERRMSILDGQILVIIVRVRDMKVRVSRRGTQKVIVC